MRKYLALYKNKTTGEQVMLWFCGLFPLITMIACWALCENIVPIYIDDVMYLGWTRHGLSYFIEKNIWHFGYFNGRTFVHLILQGVLIFEEHLYSILMPGFLAVSTFLLTFIFKKDWELHKRLLAIGFVTGSVLGLTYIYLTSTMLWMAAGFNYIFPFFIISFAYVLFYKSRDNKKFRLPALLMSFLAGATTEQYGIYMIGLIVMTIFFDLIDKKREYIKPGLLSLFSALVGYITIFLSFGTTNHVSLFFRDVGKIFSGFTRNNGYFLGKSAVPYISFIFMILFATMGLCKKTSISDKGSVIKERKYSKWLLLGYPIALANYILYLNGNFAIQGVLFLVYVIILIVGLFLKKESREYGKILVCGYGTFFMMSFAYADFRTCFPFILSMIIVLSTMVVDALFDSDKKKLVTAISITIAAGCFCNFIAIYNGSRKAAQVFSKPLYNQLKVVDQTNYIEFNFDLTLASEVTTKYRYFTTFDLSARSRLDFYQDAYGCSSDTAIHITSGKYDVSDITFNGKSSAVPVITMYGTIYVPYTLIPLDNPMFALSLSTDEIGEDGEKSYGFGTDRENLYALAPSGGLLTRQNGEAVFINPFADIMVIHQKFMDTYFVEIDDFCEWLDIRYEYDQDMNKYIFSNAE